MTPKEMRHQCVQALSLELKAKINVIFTVPKGTKFPKGFPRKELINETDHGGEILRRYAFDPLKVLAWLEENK